MTKIHESGARAFRAGIKYQDCPFKTRSLARQEWRLGWRIAREKDKEEKLPDYRAKVLVWWQEQA